MAIQSTPREIVKEKLLKRMDMNDKIRASCELLRRSDKNEHCFIEDLTLNKH